MRGPLRGGAARAACGKQRNLPGMPQVIFWDSGEECYRCARGHRFRKNGKFL